ncbi:hypothetical protein [Streptomyces sp. NBC_01216]|uniref:hypothetical protein n=1 Tax=unclassified Streptomyces TaxID=2593676 RepID=UPI002E0E65C8|nr:hypothetical protein OG393_05275 [Streptomyces sp. NBC_01216]
MTESSAGTLALGEIRGRRTDGRTLRAGTSAGALVAVLLDLFFHHLGTRSRHQAPALKSS